MNKKKEKDSNLSSLLSNPIVMGLGAIMMVPDLIPVLIGGFVGFVLSKSKKEQDGKENK